jgi:hypothetical protein
MARRRPGLAKGKTLPFEVAEVLNRTILLDDNNSPIIRLSILAQARRIGFTLYFSLAFM